jgi:hypothetical protein
LEVISRAYFFLQSAYAYYIFHEKILLFIEKSGTNLLLFVEKKGGFAMTQKKNFSLPKTSRFIVTVEKDLLKEIRKFSIDFEVNEKEVPEIALRFLMDAYIAMDRQDLAQGLAYFFPGDRPAAPASADEAEDTENEAE